MRPTNPEAANQTLVDTLQTAMLAFFACASQGEGAVGRPQDPPEVELLRRIRDWDALQSANGGDGPYWVHEIDKLSKAWTVGRVPPAPAPQPANLSLHRCKTCGTRWLLWPDAIHGGGWNLLDKYQRPGACCDNVAMGDQIEHLRDLPLGVVPAPAPQEEQLERASEFMRDVGEAIGFELPAVGSTISLRELHLCVVGRVEELKQRAAVAEDALARLTRLVARWRYEKQGIDRFHATMGSGWGVCADELEQALAPAPDRSIPEMQEPK